MRYWLVKSEPDVYSFNDLKRDKVTMWEGVRNYGARNNLRAMKKGDLVLFYHSNEGKQVVGIAKVAREAYPDPTAKKEERDTWSVVDLRYVKPLKTFVTLAKAKADPALREMQLVTRGRLSVQQVKPKEFDRILRLGETSV